MGVGLHCKTFVLVFMTERSFILVVEYFFFNLTWSGPLLRFFNYYN